MLTDGAGVPLTVAVEGANRHDSKILVATLEGLVVARPALGKEEEEAGFSEQHFLCVDAAYDSEPVREELEARGYEPHTHLSGRQGEEAGEAKGAKRGSSAAPRTEGQALGSGANAFVAEALTATTGALGEENGEELPGVHSPGLRPAHLLQDTGFRIRT